MNQLRRNSGSSGRLGRPGLALQKMTLSENGSIMNRLCPCLRLSGFRVFRRGPLFFLVSSAGGLFEGQRNVGDRSQPSPMRPYGFLKLRQEKLLQDAPPALSLEEKAKQSLSAKSRGSVEPSRVSGG